MEVANKMTYEEAVQKLQHLQILQRVGRRFRKVAGKNGTHRNLQKKMDGTRKEINYLLSIIHAHKEARKLYGILKDMYKKEVFNDPK